MILLQAVIQTLNQELANLYEDMMPLVGDMTTVARGIAGLGALLYIFNRVWAQMARNEPIDVYPLLRPFVIAMVIAAFPALVDLLNGVLSPISRATEAMVGHQNAAVESLISEKNKLLAAKPENKIFEDDAAFEKKLSELGITDLMDEVSLYFDKMKYEVQKSFREWIKNVLELTYDGIGLVINTIRVFILIVLAMVGSIAFGISVFDGFQGSLTNWIANYINVYLWLPVANIFSAIIVRIQVLMLQADIAAIKNSTTGDMNAADWNYLIFLFIAIVGYCFVPKVANIIVHASGVGGMLGQHLGASRSITSPVMASAGAVSGAVGGKVVQAGMTATNLAVNAGKYAVNVVKPK